MGQNTFLNILQVVWIISKQSFIYLFCFDKLSYIKGISKDLERINITYIKLLQNLSVNSHIFNKEQVDYLIKYTDQVPYSSEEIDVTFINQFADKNLSVTNISPINSGIIALVYEGKLNNEKIVIKVIKKNIGVKLNQAIKELELFTWIISYIPFIRTFNWYKIVKNTKDVILDQLDFNKEVENIKDFKERYKKIDYLKIPQVYEEFTKENSNIIVMEYIEGLKYNQIKEENKKEFGLKILELALHGILFHRLNHGDLHSGNIFFLEGDKNQLVFLDFGIVYRISKEDQNSMYKFCKAVYIDKNYYKAAISLQGLINPIENLNKLSDETKIEFNKNLADIIKNYLIKDPSIMFLYRCNLYLDKYNLNLSKGFCEIQMGIAASAGLTHEIGGHGDNLAQIIEKSAKNLIKETEIFNLDD